MTTGHFLARVDYLTDAQRSMLDALSDSICAEIYYSQEAALKFWDCLVRLVLPATTLSPSEMSLTQTTGLASANIFFDGSMQLALHAQQAACDAKGTAQPSSSSDMVDEKWRHVRTTAFMYSTRSQFAAQFGVDPFTRQPGPHRQAAAGNNKEAVFSVTHSLANLCHTYHRSQ